MNRNLYIAAYDVSDPGRLRGALRIARDYATGGQKSVHECFLDPVEKAELESRMRALLDEDEDRFVLVPVEPRGRVHVLGIAIAPDDPEIYYFG